MVTRNPLLLALGAALAVLVGNTIAAQEKAVLQVPGPRDDHYARVWVVEARPYLWIRAETPASPWLEPLRRSPHVHLWRGGERKPYRAVVWEGQATDARPFVDALFREKYGYVDAARALLRGTPAIPIRLEPR